MEIDKNNKIYQKIEIPFGWRRNLNYLKENIKIHLKELFEYKANIYSSLLLQISFYIFMFLFYFVLYSNFKNEINWEISDFILFIVISNFIHILIGLVYWKEDLFKSISSGNLNRHLFLPLNPFLTFYVLTQSVMMYVFFISNLIVLIFSLVYFKINIFHLNFIIIFILIFIETLIFVLFVDSFNFIKLGSSRIFKPIHENFMTLTRNYPGPFFGNLQFNFSLYLFSGYLISMVLIPILNGISILNFVFEIKILIILILFFGVGTWLNWHYGLKKYEAFG